MNLFTLVAIQENVCIILDIEAADKLWLLKNMRKVSEVLAFLIYKISAYF